MATRPVTRHATSSWSKTLSRFWRFFKLPILVTLAAMVVATIIGIGASAILTKPGTPDADQRARRLGEAVGMVTTLVIAPFWIYAVLQSGKERRDELRQRPRRKSR